MGRNRYIECSICFKNIRSDHMKTHKHDKYTKERFTLRDKLFSSKLLSELITKTPENIEKTSPLNNKLFPVEAVQNPPLKFETNLGAPLKFDGDLGGGYQRYSSSCYFADRKKRKQLENNLSEEELCKLFPKMEESQDELLKLLKSE